MDLLKPFMIKENKLFIVFSLFSHPLPILSQKTKIPTPASLSAFPFTTRGHCLATKAESENIYLQPTTRNAILNGGGRGRKIISVSGKEAHCERQRCSFVYFEPETALQKPRARTRWVYIAGDAIILFHSRREQTINSARTKFRSLMRDTASEISARS